jgi:hypothetical protein
MPSSSGRKTRGIGQYRDRKINQLDTKTGAILRTIESNRLLTCDAPAMRRWH